MREIEAQVTELHGRFRDVLRGPDGRVVWDRGWCPNAIVTDFRRLLAAFVRGEPAADGIVGLQVGAGKPEWDGPGGPPPPSTTQAALVDQNFHLVPRAQQPPPPPPPPLVQKLTFAFVDPVTGATSAVPTRSLQVQVVLGPGAPAWPDAKHPTATLREFGLVGRLDGSPVLLNYRTHPAIAKDPASTLERTIWLVF